jgi:hypothetical protein
VFGSGEETKVARWELIFGGALNGPDSVSTTMPTERLRLWTPVDGVDLRAAIAPAARTLSKEPNKKKKRGSNYWQHVCDVLQVFY